jgi:hypothetical protein
MGITYTYEIVSVDPTARCMEILYSSDGHQTMRIGARLPFENEPLENVVKLFAPTQLWVELAAPVDVPTVGLRGTIAPEIIIKSQESFSQIPVTEM